MDLDLNMQRLTKILLPPEDPSFPCSASLHFLEGQFLFRYQTGNGMQSKFLTIQDLSAAFSGKEADSGWLPAGIVRCGQSPKGDWFVYSTPAQKVDIFLEGIEKKLTISLPRLVMFGADKEYFLWALKSSHFERDQRAFRAPFPNVHEGGKICWGANTPPVAKPENARSVWNLFFSAPFNSHLVNGKAYSQMADVRELLKDLSEKKARRFPEAELVDTHARIETLIDNQVKSLCS